MWSFLVFGRLSLCFSGWVGLVSGILCGGEEVILFKARRQGPILQRLRLWWAASGTSFCPVQSLFQ
jgi:hypothetical protein